MREEKLRLLREGSSATPVTRLKSPRTLGLNDLQGMPQGSLRHLTPASLESGPVVSVRRCASTLVGDGESRQAGEAREISVEYASLLEFVAGESRRR